MDFSEVYKLLGATLGLLLPDSPFGIEIPLPAICFNHRAAQPRK
jgi:hypothetical protein